VITSRRLRLVQGCVYRASCVRIALSELRGIRTNCAMSRPRKKYRMNVSRVICDTKYI